MANVTLRLEVDPRTRRRTVVVSYASDPDALPHEHEEEHRALLDKLVEGGVLSAVEAGLVVVERPAGAPLGEPVGAGGADRARELAREGR